MKGRNSVQVCPLAALVASSCRIPRASATYTADGLAATADTGITRLLLGPSEFTPSRLT